ncbi:tyrosine-type recombinase/integrase [Actinomadura decatromicini]|uniref:Site-specific integrase n=1 Tax=Actinomadura decatromicini TaxID=2604572 RepID=A0A5D3FRP8_9ACTN|nr:site-specific integrase [Actinomadura decatromicini]TYK50718.1 site-specific integrase [Actinomadura decatromicini]
MGRHANGRSSIYLGKDGYWHGRVTVGTKDDGKPDRRHVMAKNKAEVTRKVRKLEELRDKGRVPKAGQRWTVEKWLTHWIENIAIPPSISENAHAGYRVHVEKHLILGLGAHRLDKLAPEHCEKLYAKMKEKQGLSAGTAHHVHRTLRNALNVAVRRGHLSTNPVLLATAPKLDEEEPEPYEIDEIKRLLKVARDQERNGARWVLALALGLRQGEALGLKWEDVDLATGMIRVRRGRLRPRYTHGCGDNPCGRKAGYCPERQQARPETGRTKSKAGRRVIGLPAPLVGLLKAHKAQQDVERDEAHQLWREGGYVFTKPDGEPLNPNTDYHEWKALLERAGLRETRLHDARQTAATVLLILGVPTPTAMAIMGWSSASMAKRYQHMSDTIRNDVAARVGDLLWE